MNKEMEQTEIAEWFNKTYRRRGEFYLRPVKAYYIFLELLGIKPKDNLLDVACGLGRLLEAATQGYSKNLYGVDISSVAVDKAKKKLPKANIQVANAEQLPFPNNQFDYVTCLGSLERMMDLRKVLNELLRVGNDHCKYCFLVRNANTLSWKYLKKGLGLTNEKGHQGANTLEGWMTTFKDSGFSVLEVLPDQYPLHKRQFLKYLGLKKVNYHQPVKSSRALEYANEFIFILEKK